MGSGFDCEQFEARKDNWPDTATRLPNDAASGEVDHYVTEDEHSSAHEEERRSERNESDVTKNEIRPRPTSSRDVTSPLSEPPSKAHDENDVTNELYDEEIASKGGADVTVPGISENKKTVENTSPRGGNLIFDLSTPKFTDEYRFQSDMYVRIPLVLSIDRLIFLGTILTKRQ